MKKIFTLCVVLCMSYLSMGATNLKHEFRATWLTTAWGNDWPKTKVTNDATRKQQQDSLIAIFDRLQAGNMNAVCLQVRGRSDAFYQSSYEPWAAELAGARGKDPGYDPLAFAIEEAHKRGLELHAWVNPFRVTSAGTLDANDLVKKNADQWIIQYNNGSFTGEIIDPGYPEAREYVLNVLMEIISNYDIDGIVMDDYFYPYGGTTTEDAASKALHKPANVVDVNQDGYTDDDWRRSNVDVFLKEFYNRIQTTKPWVRLGMGTFGIWTTQSKVAQAYGIALPSGISGLDDYDEQACNPVEWVKNGYVDYINPQLYWPTTSTGQNYNKLCHWWAKDVCEHFSNQLTNGKKVHFFSSQSISANPTLSEIQAEIDANRSNLSSGYTGSVFFDTDAYLTMDKDLMTSRFATNALTPPMDWKSNTALAAPTNLTVSGSTLSWQHPTAERFTVYVYPKGTAWSTAKNDPAYLQGVIYGKSMDISGIDTNANDIAVCAYDRFGVEHTAAVYSNDSGAGTTPNPETIIWELNGGEVNTVTVEVPSLTTLEAQFKNDYNSYFGASVATTREITNFLYYGSKEEGGSNLVYNMMNDPAADWTWLRDYIISKSASNTTIQTALLAGTDAHWRYSIVAFLTASAGTNSTYTVDFSIAGQPSKWGTAYQIAHGAVLLPTYVTSAFTLPIPTHPEGHDFLGWYDNAEFIGSPLTTISADWTGSLYAKWQEDTPTIDPTWQITYTSSNDSIVTPYATDVFGANIVSNTYQDGQGVITFDGPVTSIGEKAFYQCKSLASITIPNSVTSIGDLAFEYCTSLTSVTIPNSVTSIGSSAFYPCYSLTSISIPNSVTSIGIWAFEGTGVYNEESNWENDVLYIDNCLIEARTSISGAYAIKENTRLIADYAFYYCSSLTSVTIGNSVTTIGKYAFCGCSSLISITIPNSVTSIGDCAFYNCAFTKDNFINNSTLDAEKNNYWGARIGDKEIDGLLIKDDTILVACRPHLTSVTIPNSVTSIGWYAFYGCSSLTSVSIPNSVTSIGIWAFEDTGIYNEESNWENDVLYIDNCLIEARTSISGAYAIKENTRLIADYAFRDCSSLTSITIPNSPNSVMSIGSDAFYYCSSLTSVTIGNSVTSIGDLAFEYCTSLTSVTIPNSVTSIGRNAFSGCSSLISITIPNSVTSIGDCAFYVCSSLTSVTLNSNDIVSTSHMSNIFGSQVEEYVIGDSVTSIGASAFSGCSSLISITIPNSVTSIGDGAFWGCSSLTKTNYTGDIAGWCDIKFVGNLSNPIHYSHNFYINDVKIKDLVIPNSVDSIYDYAFYGCSSLTSVTIPNSVTSIGDDAFYNCTSIESIFCYSNTPPSIVQYRSPFSQYNATLYVPSSTPYKNHSVWGNFEKIVSMGNEMIFTHDGLYYKTISSESIISLSLLTQENFNKFTPISLIGSQNWRYDSKYGAKMSGFQDNVTHQNEDWLISPAMDLSKYSSATLEFSHAFGPAASVPTTATQKAQYTCWISNDFNGDVTTATWTELPITYGTSAWSFISTTVDIPAENLKENCRIAWKYVCDDESATWEINSVDVTGAPIQQVEVISGPNKYSGDIVVPATVTMNDTVYNVVAIGTEAFYNCSSLTSLAIPTSIKRIGTNAIVGTSSLTAITLTAASIEEHCNGELNKLLRQLGYTIPRILQINDNKLSDIIIPETVSRISDYAFYNCSSLTSITIPNSIKSIGNHAFYECASLKDISIPNSVTTLGQSVFENCISLKSAYVGNGITSLDNSTFISCSSLESVTLGGRIVHIGESVFSGCTALNEITLPASVKSIGENAFAGCTKLYDIYCFAMEPPTASESSFANYNAFLHVPCDNQRVYLLDVLFGNFKYIECIVAETTPTDTVVVTPSFNDAEFIWPSYGSADSYTLAISKDGEIFCTLTFNANGQLTGIAFAPSRNGQHKAPAAAQTANGFAFTVTGLDEGSNYTYELLIQDRSGNTLQSYSGEFCTQSTNDHTVTVEYDAAQGQVTGAGTYLVGDTVTLTAIPNYGYHFVQWSDGNTDNPRTLVLTQDTILTAEFALTISGQCGDNLYWAYDEASKTIAITGSGDMYDYTKDTQPWLLFQDQITEVTTSNTTTSIGDWAFDDCSGLTSVTIGNSVTSIGEQAFNGCSSLTSITIPNSVTSIGEGAFEYCSSLDTIHVEATTPPALEDSTVFMNTPSPVCVIPCGTLATYQSSDWANQVGSFVEDCSAKITYELNGGVTNEYGWMSKDDMYHELLVDINAIIPTSRVDVDTVTLAYDKTKNIQKGIPTYWDDLSSLLIHSDFLSKWGWLINYMDSACASGSKYLPSTLSVYLRYNLSAFFFEKEYTSWPQTPDYSKYGLYYNFQTAWKHAYTNPTNPTEEFTLNTPYKEGYTFAGWYTNADLSGEKITIVEAETNDTLYAKWIENSLVESTWKVLYTSTNGGIVAPNAIDVFGANIVSNTYENGVGTITFDGPVTSIGTAAFHDCLTLKSITIPNSVNSIGVQAFRDCSAIDSLTIPENVNSISGWAFMDCSSLLSIVVAQENMTYDSRENCNAIIETATNTLIVGCKKTIIPNGVATIGEHAFRISSLAFITIPNSVTNIERLAFCGSSIDTIYVEATTPPALADSTVFMYTPSPVCVIPCGTKEAYEASDWANYMGEFIEEGCPTVQMCGDDLYWEYADGLLTITGTGDMYDYADDKTGPAPWYDVRGSITTINMPNEMTKIGDYAFYKCTEVTSINMPTTLTAIGEKAFAQDTKLACEIILPASMTTIASRAFFNCQAVTAFHIEATTPPTIPNDAFERTTAPIHVPCGYGHVYSKHTQWGMLNLEMCELLQDNVYYYPIDGHTARAVTYHSNPTDTIVIPSAVVIDGMPRTVTEVADFAFTDCKDIPAIIFNEGLEYIGERAFVRCYGLQGTIVLPATLETIGERAFSYCNNVEKYLIQAMTPPVLGANVFTGDNKNALFYISCEVMDDYKVATNWSSLKSRLRDACLNIYHYNTPLGTNGVYTTEDTLVASIYYRRQFTTSRWETLYLPFEVDRVTVLEDGVEYDLNAWSIFSGGHYYLAKPYGIENKEVVFGFTQVVDAHTPYIIQFKEPYYHDKMITFHGKESWNKLSTSFEALPISFEMQMAGNTTMQDQILEEPVYMLRGTSNFILQNTTTVLHPFECYVMPSATSSGTPARMNVRFRGDVPTAVESVKGNESHLTYTVDGYTLTVYPQGQAFSIYSLNGALIYSCEAGKEAVDCELNSGCYLLHAGAEAHKIML